MNILVKKNSRSLLTIVALVFGMSVSVGLSAQEYPGKPAMNKKPAPVESKHPGTPRGCNPGFAFPTSYKHERPATSAVGTAL